VTEPRCVGDDARTHTANQQTLLDGLTSDSESHLLYLSVLGMKYFCLHLLFCVPKPSLVSFEVFEVTWFH